MTNEIPPSIRPPEPTWTNPDILKSVAGSADGGDFHQYELNAFRFLLGRQPAYGFERKSVTSNAFEVMIQNYAAFLFEYGKTTGSISAHGVGVLGSPAATDKFTFRPNRVGSEQYHLGSTTYPFDNLVSYQELVVNLDISGALSVSGQDTPDQITADTNNYTGADGGVVIRLSTDASRTITGMRTGYFDLLTGISNTTSPSLRIIHNVGSNDIVFADEDSGSDEANRFALAGEDLTISPDESVIFVYDDTSDRWRAAGVYQVQAAVPSAAAQSDQETATSTTTYVSPGRQQYHPSAAKFWLKATANSTTIEASYNITSVADTATGRMTVTIATDFSGVDWAGALSVVHNYAFSGLDITQVNALALDPSPAAGTCVMEMTSIPYTVSGGTYGTPALFDPTAWLLVGYGDQS